MYGAECWPATKEVETRLSVMETKMMRWTAGVTRMGRIRNNAIRQKFGVAPTAEKMREARLRWYGHVLRGKEDRVRKIGLNFEVIGKRPRGRSKQRWSDTLQMDMKVTGVQAQDRGRSWKRGHIENRSHPHVPPRLHEHALTYDCQVVSDVGSA
ncbi:unnamed protein product [Heligmosomoides polygyrus]|uniref:HTH myb-type domain-containing protein n=1 Tax=Heligmosomoides polygyrus TaxID=6339 RepID=A0A183FUF4_HELPZ|nr:unnamed protein product [Heligmosomoides polygyrus]